MIRSSLLAVLLAGFGAAASATSLSAVQTVKQEIVTVSETGEETVELVDATVVAPGTTVIYALAYTNDGGASAENVVLTMPVPAEVDFLSGTADMDGTDVTYSINGGETFVDWAAIETGLGETGDTPAISHIRWQFTQPIPGGATGEISYRGILQ